MFDLAGPVLVSECGTVVPLDIERFCGEPSPAERRILSGLTGPVLDVGCGPGRAAAFLRRRHVPALGLDVSAVLVALARRNGALCVHQSIFDPVPFEGRWAEVLLLDGNIGIGGDPGELLVRLHQVVRPDGTALVEVDAIGPTKQFVVREQAGAAIGDPFPWAVVSLAGLDELAANAGWQCEQVHRVDRRPIVQLRRRP